MIFYTNKLYMLQEILVLSKLLKILLGWQIYFIYMEFNINLCLKSKIYYLTFRFGIKHYHCMSSYSFYFFRNTLDLLGNLVDSAWNFFNLVIPQWKFHALHTHRLKYAPAASDACFSSFRYQTSASPLRSFSK